MRKILLAGLLALLVPSSILAQEAIKGVIRDDSGETLPGSTVVIKGTNTSSIADVNGEFTIATVKELPFTLVVNSVGYKAQDIEIYELSEELIDVTLKSDNILEEIVVVGYGELKRKDITG